MQRQRVQQTLGGKGAEEQFSTEGGEPTDSGWRGGGRRGPPQPLCEMQRGAAGQKEGGEGESRHCGRGTEKKGGEREAAMVGAETEGRSRGGRH
eukprot:5535275-Pleurochrysis_carterae.AAC.1